LTGRRVLLVGCGDIGTGLGERLLARGAEVWGLKRLPDDLPAGFHRVAGDFTDPASLEDLQGEAFDDVVVTLTPAEHSDAAYETAYVGGLRNVLAALDPAPGFVVFVSSTSVYHQDDHGWVDETSPTEPATFSGQRTLEAEAVLRACGLPHVIVRFSGIYGPGRTYLIDQVKAGRACGPEDRLYTNRIHREDGIGFLDHLLARHHAGDDLHDLYLATDSYPVTMWDVQSWIASKLGIDPFSLKTGPVPGRTSKRCRNARMRNSGYELRYPDYMSGYGELLSD
jgi:nucleoside-diphosphate-sugar epimerase